MNDTATRNLTAANITWDTRDPDNHGWAYRVAMSNGREESGPWERELGQSPTIATLALAVVTLCAAYGVEIHESEVAIIATDGGGAFWRATDEGNQK